MNHKERPDYAVALRIAKAQSMIGELHRVEDAWGGYWQCQTPHGPYTFRCATNGEREG